MKMHRRWLVVLLIAVLALGPSAVAVSSRQTALLAAVNRHRVVSLEPDAGMMRRSQQHAQRMAEAEHLFHSRLRLPVDAVWAGEVIGVGKNIRVVVRAWLASPEHRAIILRRQAHVAGAGVAEDDDGDLWMVVQVAQLEDTS